MWQAFAHIMEGEEMMGFYDEKVLNQGYPEPQGPRYPREEDSYDEQIEELANIIRTGIADGQTVWTMAKHIIDKKYRKMEE